MTLPVTFGRAAYAAFIKAVAWYEAQRPDLGGEFIARIERCILLAAAQLRRCAVVHNGIRRVVANRFPYSICFRAQVKRIVVLAVFHSSRDPTIWQRREG